jgi:DNA polymerase III delta prime subunit
MCNSYKLSVKRFMHSDLQDNAAHEWSDNKTFNSETSIAYESRLKSFDKFLQQTRFQMLLMTNTDKSLNTDHCVHFVSELPLTHESKRQKSELFEILRNNIIRSDSNRRRNPIVIIHHIFDSPTVASNLNRSFPKEILQAPNVVVVQMKPFGKRDMKTVLTRILANEKRLSANAQAYDFRALSNNENMENIITKADGDLRQAIMQLQFLTTRQADNMSGSSDKKEADKLYKKFTNFKFDDIGTDEIVNKRRRQDSKFDLLSYRKAVLRETEDTSTRDSIVDIHHAAARVLYGKRKPNGKLDFNLEKDVLNSVHANENVVVSYMHHNLPRFCSSIEDLSRMMENFSIGDTFCHSRLFSSGQQNGTRVNADYEKESLSIYNFLISSYGTMYYNQKHRTKNDFRQIYAPKITKVFFEAKSLREEMIQNFAADVGTTSSSMTEDYVPYQHLIYNTCQNRRDIVNGTRVVTPDAQLRAARFAQLQKMTSPQRSLLARIHMYTFRGTNTRVNSFSSGNDDMEAYVDEQEENETENKNIVILPPQQETTLEDEIDEFE